MLSRLRISNRIDSRGVSIPTRAPITPDEANRAQESILMRSLRELREPKKEEPPPKKEPEQEKKPYVSQQERSWRKLMNMLTADEVAAVLKIDRWTVIDYAKDKKIRAYVIAREYRFFKSDVLEFVKSCSTQPET